MVVWWEKFLVTWNCPHSSPYDKPLFTTSCSFFFLVFQSRLEPSRLAAVHFYIKSAFKTHFKMLPKMDECDFGVEMWAIRLQKRQLTELRAASAGRGDYFGPWTVTAGKRWPCTRQCQEKKKSRYILTSWLWWHLACFARKETLLLILWHLHVTIIREGDEGRSLSCGADRPDGKVCAVKDGWKAVEFSLWFRFCLLTFDIKSNCVPTSSWIKRWPD